MDKIKSFLTEAAAWLLLEWSAAPAATKAFIVGMAVGFVAGRVL